MKSDKGIAMYHRITQENRLFNFLGGLDRKFDAIRREILRLNPLPSVESGHAVVWKGAARLRILTPAASEGGD